MTTVLMNPGIQGAPLSVELVAEYLTYAENELTALYSAVSELFGFEQAQLAVEDWLTELEAMEWPAESPIPNWRRPTVAAVSRLTDRIGGHRHLCAGRMNGGCKDDVIVERRETLPRRAAHHNVITADGTQAIPAAEAEAEFDF